MRTIGARLLHAKFVVPAFLLVALVACGQESALSQEKKSGKDSIVELRQSTGVRALPNGSEISSGTAAMRITALRDDILRMQVSRDGTFPPDHSWAVLPEMRASKTQV